MKQNQIANYKDGKSGGEFDQSEELNFIFRIFSKVCPNRPNTVSGVVCILVMAHKPTPMSFTLAPSR